MPHFPQHNTRLLPHTHGLLGLECNMPPRQRRTYWRACTTAAVEAVAKCINTGPIMLELSSSFLVH